MIQERILKIMSNYGLNAGQFAEKLGVQPSSISHILSGRNKPSLDFVTKLLNSFPQIDYMWLVMGKGSMMKLYEETETSIVSSEKQKEGNEQQTKNSELSLFSQENTNSEKSEILKIEDKGQENEKESPLDVKQIKNNSTNINSSSIKINKTEDEIQKQDDVILKSSYDKELGNYKNKTISKIIVFYTDNTFDELIKKQ